MPSDLDPVGAENLIRCTDQGRCARKNVGTYRANYVQHSVAPAMRRDPDGDLEILVSSPIGVFGTHRHGRAGCGGTCGEPLLARLQVLLNPALGHAQAFADGVEGETEPLSLTDGRRPHNRLFLPGDFGRPQTVVSENSIRPSRCECILVNQPAQSVVSTYPA